MTLAHGTGVWRNRRDFVTCTGRGISVSEDIVMLRRGVTVAGRNGQLQVRTIGKRSSGCGRPARRFSSRQWMLPARFFVRTSFVTGPAVGWRSW